MSHFTRIETKIVDLHYLRRALADLELPFEEGRLKLRGYLGRRMTVDLRVRTPEGSDIGFLKAAGAYHVAADWDMVKSFSPESFVREVSRRYVYQVVKDELEAQNFRIVEERREGDAVSLTLRRS